MRVIVCGPRDYEDTTTVCNQLNLLVDDRRLGEGFVLVHGACPTGVDSIAEQWFWSLTHDERMHMERYPAEDFGRWPECGPLRNRHMAELGADLCLAFGVMCRKNCPRQKIGPHMTHGTASMVNEALRNDIEVRIIPV